MHPCIVAGLGHLSRFLPDAWIPCVSIVVWSKMFKSPKSSGDTHQFFLCIIMLILVQPHHAIPFTALQLHIIHSKMNLFVLHFNRQNYALPFGVGHCYIFLKKNKTTAIGMFSVDFLGYINSNNKNTNNNNHNQFVLCTAFTHQPFSGVVSDVSHDLQRGPGFRHQKVDKAGKCGKTT